MIHLMQVLVWHIYIVVCVVFNCISYNLLMYINTISMPSYYISMTPIYYFLVNHLHWSSNLVEPCPHTITFTTQSVANCKQCWLCACDCHLSYSCCLSTHVLVSDVLVIIHMYDHVYSFRKALSTRQYFEVSFTYDT